MKMNSDKNSAGVGSHVTPIPRPARDASPIWTGRAARIGQDQIRERAGG